MKKHEEVRERAKKVDIDRDVGARFWITIMIAYRKLIKSLS
jgi:hypothetical protein